VDRPIGLPDSRVRGATQQSLAEAYQSAARLDKQQSLIEADDGAATEQAKVASSAKPPPDRAWRRKFTMGQARKDPERIDGTLLREAATQIDMAA
jgi:hypothetical protein